MCSLHVSNVFVLVSETCWPCHFCVLAQLLIHFAWVPSRYISCHTCVSCVCVYVFHACAGLSIDLCLSFVCLSYVHVPPLPKSGHFLGFVMRIFYAWCFLVSHSNLPEPCGRYTCYPVCEASVNHAVPTSISIWVLGLLSALLWLRISSCGVLSLLIPGLVSFSPFKERVNFKFLLFPVLVPCWVP